MVKCFYHKNGLQFDGWHRAGMARFFGRRNLVTLFSPHPEGIMITKFWILVVCVVVAAIPNADCSYPHIYFQKLCANDSDVQLTFPGTGDRSAGSILMNPKNIAYEAGLNCTVTFVPEHGFQLLVSFSNVSLRNSSLDNLTVVYDDGKSETVLASQQVCSNEDCVGLKFESGKGGNITFKFISANITVPQNLTGFRASYTVFDLANSKSGICDGEERFLCNNEHCIFDQLVCDGHNNCGDRSDETKCVIPVSDTIWGIVVIVMAIVSMLIFVPLFCCLAVYGTRSVVRSITLTAQDTQLLPTATNYGEMSGLLTSSSGFWPSTSAEHHPSPNYGSVPSETADAGKNTKQQL